MSIRGAVQILVVALLLGANIASAQNLVVNPDFNRDTAGWAPVFGPAVLSWNTVDSDDSFGVGSRPSGSLHIVNQGNAGANMGASQCFNNPFPGVTEGRDFKYGGEVRIPAQANTGCVFITLYTYPAADCAGAPSGPGVTCVPTTGQTWLQLKGVYTVDPGVQSFIFQLLTRKDAAGDFQADFDQIYLLDCDTTTFDLNSDDSNDSTDLVIGANRLVGNVGCLPTQ